MGTMATDGTGIRWQRTAVAAAAVTGAAALLIACTPPVAPVDPLPVPVTEYLVDGDLPGVSFATVGDVLGDSTPELVVSQFGSPLTAPGSVTLFEVGSGLGDWSSTPVVTPADGILFPNDTVVDDLNGDGLPDVIVSGGFFSCAFSGSGCGTLAWFEQGPAGSFTRHDIITPQNTRFYHRAIVTDVDGDGITDLVTVGETIDSARTEWYRGRALGGAERFDDTALVIGNGGGSLPVVSDIDGDGDEDVLSPQFFASGPAVIWFERTGEPSAATPAGTWVRHRLDGTGIGRGFELELVDDLLGDGVDRWIGTNHQNDTFDMTAPAAVFRFDPGPDPRLPWSATAISTGIQARPKGPTTLAPGLLGTGDVDLDGRTDVVVSGDGDERLFVLLQNPDASFTTYTLALDMGQAGGAEVTDFDGDGRPEAMFTSYENGVLKLYEFGD